MSKTSQDIVTRFCEAWERRSVEDVLSHLSPNVIYQNVPSPAMQGIEEVGHFLRPLITSAVRIEFELLNIAVSACGDRVLTERMDRLHFAGGIVDIPVMGIFVVEDDTITQWRDYADSASVADGFAKVNSSS